MSRAAQIAWYRELAGQYGGRAVYMCRLVLDNGPTTSLAWLPGDAYVVARLAAHFAGLVIDMEHEPFDAAAR